jgi:hypothetical protein
MAERELYGILAEFRDPESLVAASQRVHDAGYKWFEAYSPFPVHGLAKAIGFHHTKVPQLVLMGGILGCIGGFSLQYWVSVYAYPLNIGGRPMNSWPSFIPVTFETTILLAALSAVLGMLALNGLPRLHHPLFAVPDFDRATRDAFFLCIQARDKQFDRENTRKLLADLHAVQLIDVPTAPLD